MRVARAGLCLFLCGVGACVPDRRLRQHPDAAGFAGADATTMVAVPDADLAREAGAEEAHGDRAPEVPVPGTPNVDAHGLGSPDLGADSSAPPLLDARVPGDGGADAPALADSGAGDSGGDAPREVGARDASSAGDTAGAIDGCGPATVATCVSLWLSADLGVTATGGLVSLWADQSGQQNDAWMTTVERQPSLLAAALNGHAALHFAGGQSLLLTRSEQPRSFSIFVVGRNNQPDESFSIILGPRGSEPNDQLRWQDGNDALIDGQGNALSTTTTAIGNTRVYHVLGLRFDGAWLDVYRDGRAVSHTPLTSNGPWTVGQIGAWYSMYFMVGDLAELLIYDSALTDADLNQTNDYLRARYALP